MSDAEILNRLADIELPSPPDWQPLLIAGGAVIGVLILTALIYIYIQRREKTRSDDNARPDPAIDPAIIAQEKLQQLIADWQSCAIDDREAAYRLATLLRLGLALPQITRQRPDTVAADQHIWQETIEMCEQLRYQQMPGRHLSLEILQRAEQWLTNASQTVPEKGA